MALTELMEAIKKQVLEQRKTERELLEWIAMLSDIETAEAAEELFRPDKHAYSFDGYLYQLEKVCDLLEAGLQPDDALIQADTCMPIEQIIKNFREVKYVNVERTKNTDRCN